MLHSQNLFYIHILYTQKGVYSIFEYKKNFEREAFRFSMFFVFFWGQKKIFFEIFLIFFFVFFFEVLNIFAPNQIILSIIIFIK